MFSITNECYHIGEVTRQDPCIVMVAATYTSALNTPFLACISTSKMSINKEVLSLYKQDIVRPFHNILHILNLKATASTRTSHSNPPHLLFRPYYYTKGLPT